MQRTAKFASLYLRAKISSNFFRPPSPNYSDSGEFLLFHFLYFTQTYGLYSYELEQLVFSDDGYRVWFFISRMWPGLMIHTHRS